MTIRPENAVHYAIEQAIAVLTVDFPPVNVLAFPVRAGLACRLDAALCDDEVAAIVIVGAKDRFIAGADVREFNAPRQPPTIADLQAKMEAASKPIVCAIDGYALGGGLELALAAHYRVATRQARLGLPEVRLGLLPGAGGTQRLPRLAGAAAALELILSGRHMTSTEAAAHGIIDAVVNGDVRSAAIAFARAKAAAGPPWPVVMAGADKLVDVASDLFAEVRSRNARKWAGTTAPAKIVDCVEAAARLPPAEALAFERAAFEACQAAPERAALTHLFFAQRTAAKVEGLDRATRAAPIRAVGVVGAGTMGRGIAMGLADAGLAVRLLDASAEALAAGLTQIDATYRESIARGSTDGDRVAAARARICGAQEYAELAEADLVIEAVFESPALKAEVFARIDAVAKRGAVLATNTSALDVDAIARATQRPQDVIGLHFFSPANVMELVEVVRGTLVSEATVARAMTFAKAIGKVPVLAGNREGFIGNRILQHYGAAADALLLEGATPWQIDRALEQFGFAMGVFRVRDMAGLDVAQRMRANRIAAGTLDPAAADYMPLADRLCEEGRFGQKTGAGYYLYAGRKARPDPMVEAMLERIAVEKGRVRRPIDDARIISRMLAAMVDEGQRVLAEGVAQRASDIDVTMVLGYGFPSFRGGPMFWSEQQAIFQAGGSTRRLRNRSQRGIPNVFPTQAG